jgi:hypothetical protein
MMRNGRGEGNKEYREWNKEYRGWREWSKEYRGWRR